MTSTRARDSMLDGPVRIPMVEAEISLRQQLSVALRSADAILCPDDEGNLDGEQSIPAPEGMRCHIVKAGVRETP